MKTPFHPYHFEGADTEFNISDFTLSALDTFRYQYEGNPVYRRFVDILGRSPQEVRNLEDIPFLPIRFFKSHKVVTGNDPVRRVFRSSGTSASGDSLHHVTDTGLYDRSLMAGFWRNYGDPRNWCILALLPNYLEKGDSSLVYMADQWMRAGGHPDSGFYLDQFDRLHETLKRLEAAGQQTLLLGVTYALLDFSERFPGRLEHVVVMETGGMKGRKREMIRAEVHDILKERWQLEAIHSEYGMTELLSQAYAPTDGLFSTPPWMRVLIRAEDDPFAKTAIALDQPVTGLVDIIDLANSNACAFVSTDDVGRLHPDGRFEIIGRLDNSDLRGCSLLAI